LNGPPRSPASTSDDWPRFKFPEKLPFFLWFALSDANRTWRIALPNCLLDWEKLGFAMQIAAARNMKEFFVSILRDCY
jgi:hypothetical protein